MRVNRFISAFLISVALFSCNKQNTTTTSAIPEPQPVERKLTTVEFNDYETNWEEVKALEEKDLGKTIIQKVDGILEKALKDENVPQVYKALVYRSKYINRVEEESTFKILNRFEEEIEKADFPLKQLLHSATAQLYHQYYQQNRWRFSDRTATSNFKAEDLRSWSLQQILDKIEFHYQASLQDKNQLLLYATENFEEILSKREGVEKSVFDGSDMRPSLYEFLADRALSFYESGELRVSEPINEFKVDNYPVLSPARQFIEISFAKNDTASATFKSAKLFQEILSFHINDKNPEVFIDFNLRRLYYFYSKSKIESKEKDYLNALQQMSEKYKTSASIAEIDYKIAQYYYQKGMEYNSEEKDESKKLYLKKAHEICSKYLDDNSFGAEQCKILHRKIEKSFLSFQSEQVYLPKQKNKVRLEYKNLDSIFLRIVQLPNIQDEIYENYRNQEEELKKVFERQALKEWKVKLQNPEDFQLHSSELQLPELNYGKYILLMSENGKFKISDQLMAYSFFTVSELSYISKRDEKGAVQTYYILNRKSGMPVDNAMVYSYKSEYNYTSRKHSSKLLNKYTTDKEGKVKVSSSNNENFRINVVKGVDTLNLNENFYLSSYNGRNNNKRITTYYFTDRVIYRPGQTVYYKGIVVESNKDGNELQKNFSANILLRNVNGEKLQERKHTTNEFGSFEGSFVLPSSGLNGNYTIQDKHGRISFSVEEYKRPTFKVKLDTMRSTPKINSDVTASGQVQFYSGANVSDATVQYRIVRRATYPYWPYWRGFFPGRSEKEIANGSLKTDSEGKFSITFFAAADESVQAKWNPSYQYEIMIDASSQSGETQSLTEYISLGVQSFYLSTSLDEVIQLEELKNLKVFAKNVNGQPVQKEALLKLYKLKTPESPVVPGLWKEADLNIMDSDLKTRPAEPVNNNGIENFERGTLLSKERVKTNIGLNLFADVKPGAYELELVSQEGKSEEIKFNQRFILFDENAKKPPYPVFSFFEAIQKEGEPGNEAAFLLATGLENLKVLYEVVHDGRVVSKEWVTLNNEQKRFSIPIKEEYRGNFHVHFAGIHSNRTIQYNETVNVPFTNKKLKLELGTFRDKVEPGSTEKWTMTISGMKGEKFAAELLAGMYDQSLDQFRKAPEWQLNLNRSDYDRSQWAFDRGFGFQHSTLRGNYREDHSTIQRHYPQLNWFGFNINNRGFYYDDMMVVEESVEMEMQSVAVTSGNQDRLPKSKLAKSESDASNEREDEKKKSESASNPLRSDFRETAFFFPQLKTDEKGKITFEFQMPDALTEWKFRAMAHTKELKTGAFEKSIQTQKKLMVNPNVPRFFRENDDLQFTILINNLDDQFQNGYAKLKFFNAFTGNPIDIFNGDSGDRQFNVAPGKNTIASWKIRIPEDVQALMYRVEVKSNEFSDGEEKVIPVLPNRMLVTESFPLAVRGNQKKDFVFEKLVESQSGTLAHSSYTVEFTPNPAWYALQALPYLAAGENECSEKVFSRLYANSLAEKVANDNPRIKQIFELWKNNNSKELTSKLMQNQELKNILIEETPWLRQAKNEGEQKRMIALLFDYNRMAKEKSAAISKLQELQLPNGGWAWYKGMQDNRHITQYIINGLGHLKKLGISIEDEAGVNNMINKGLTYLDDRIEEDYQDLIKNKQKLAENHLSYNQIYYLYTRSFFLNRLPETKAYQYYLGQAEEFWQERNIYMKGMQAMALHRLKSNSKVPDMIVASLKDNALQTEELGMYWKENRSGYYWYNSSIETQAMMIELFQEVASDQKSVEELRVWLLKQKQTQMWSNSKATAVACYALLIGNKNAFSTENRVSIQIGGDVIKPKGMEAGTAYFKKVYDEPEINKELGFITVDKKNEGIAWGAAYWQYYENIDQISSADVEELSISKTLFRVEVNGSGESMKPIDATQIQVGDKVRVRLRLESRRDLQFVHLKDMRAAGFEPLNVSSGYRYQDGLGYYESTKDASTNFFIDWLNKGVYVFEYDLRATVSGEFSNGISTIQCQYAPEFSSHSKGKRITIK